MVKMGENLFYISLIKVLKRDHSDKFIGRTINDPLCRNDVDYLPLMNSNDGKWCLNCDKIDLCVIGTVVTNGNE